MPPETMAGTAAAKVTRKKKRRAGEPFRAHEKGYPVGDREAHREVSNRGDGKIDQDFAERIHLVLVAHGSNFEEGETAVHGEDENGPHQ